MIHLVAIITAKKGARAQLLDLVRENIPRVRAEPGCLEYSPVVDLPSSGRKFGEDTYLVIEKWQDEAALAAHRTAAHMVEYAAQSKHLIENRLIYLLGTAD